MSRLVFEEKVMEVYVQNMASLVTCDFLYRPVEKEVTLDGVIVLDDDCSLLPLITGFLNGEMRAFRISPKTAKTYGSNLIYFLRYLRELESFSTYKSDKPLLDVTLSTLDSYYIWLRSVDGKEPATIHNREATIKSLFDKYLCKKINNLPALRADNPYQDSEYLTKSGKGKIPEACDIRTLELLMMCTIYEKERTIIQVVFDIGCRVSEIEEITKADIDEALRFVDSKFYSAEKNEYFSVEGYVPLRISGAKGKNRQVKERFTIISVPALKRLLRYFSNPSYKKYSLQYMSNDEMPIFFNTEGRKFTAKNIQKLFDKVSKRALKKGWITKAVSPHKGRNGFGYEILRSEDLGKGYLDRLVNLVKLMGHNDLKTSEGYTQVPVELYDTITAQNGATLTKCERMQAVYDRTKLNYPLRGVK